MTDISNLTSKERRALKRAKQFRRTATTTDITNEKNKCNDII